MNWVRPTPDIIRALRARDGGNYYIPQEYLNCLLMDQQSTVYFPIYALDGRQVGWNSRSATQKMWSQNLVEEPTPRFTSWTPALSQIVYGHRKICITEGPYDALALAPIIPWVIAANTARVQQEILDWCDMWKLHVFTAFDNDKPDPKTNREAGQMATARLTKELLAANCRVTQLTWPKSAPNSSTPGQIIPSDHLKDPAQAYAVMGKTFHEYIANQVNSAVKQLQPR